MIRIILEQSKTKSKNPYDYSRVTPELPKNWKRDPCYVCLVEKKVLK